jgi:polysaccharide export outer membrane protein
VIDFNSLIGRIAAVTAAAAMVLTVSGCGSTPNANLTPEQQAATPDYEYLIGPGDTMEVFVWGNPDLSTNVTVKPTARSPRAWSKISRPAARPPRNWHGI